MAWGLDRASEQVDLARWFSDAPVAFGPSPGLGRLDYRPSCSSTSAAPFDLLLARPSGILQDQPGGFQSFLSPKGSYRC